MSTTPTGTNKKQKETKGSSDRLRVQVDFSEDALNRLEELRERTESGTKSDVIRNALRLYEWMVEQSEMARTIEVKEKNGDQVSKTEAKWFLR